MKPTQSYRVWMSQRNGSTYFCKSIEQTGLAGKPLELFNISPDSSLCETYGCSSYEELRDHLWHLGTVNGVFGIKHSYMRYRNDQILSELAQLRGLDEDDPSTELQIWNNLFPNCQHIFLTRRNKIRQSVSWWKAINDNAWHLETGDTHVNDPSFYKDKYNFDALMHLWKETNLRECSIQEFFDRNDITPLTFIYEDFIKDINATVCEVLDFLKIEYDNVHFGKPYYQKIADEHSEQWVQQFRSDMQKGWDKIIW